MNNKIYKFLNGNILPEITVIPTRLSLSTYYPIVGGDYRYTGHSSLRARSPEYIVYTSDGFTTIPANSATIDKKSSDADYNFITNNCADATRCALEAITGKKMNPYFFTTPGDVLDFFKENFDDVRKVKNKNSGKEIYYTNITPKQLEIIKEQLLEQIQKNRKERHKELLANARKWKHKSGGAFRIGVNVLDSNPKMSKAASKKVKKHLYGGDVNNPNAMGGTAFTSWLNYLLRLPELLKLKEEERKRKLELEQLESALKTNIMQNLLGTVGNFAMNKLGNLLNNKSAKIDNGAPATSSFWNTPTIKNALVTGDFWNTPTIANSLA